MKKTLKIEVVSRSESKVIFKIVEQSHRGKEFGSNGERFAASNNIDLFSAYLPEWEKPCGRFYTCGRNSRCDNDKISVTIRDFARIEAAIAEYNAFDFEE